MRAQLQQVGTTTAQRTDALALALGTRATVALLLVACAIVVVVGAQSMLGTLEQMDTNIAEMNEQLAIANEGVTKLNTTMDSVPKQVTHLAGVIDAVRTTGEEVQSSADSIDQLVGSTGAMATGLEGIAANTDAMRTDHEGAAKHTTELRSTVTQLGTTVPPLVRTQRDMRGETQRMQFGLDAMNGSLGYVIRILNFLTAPPTGQGMKLKAALPKETLPPVPGVTAQTKPIDLFPRLAWPIYREQP